MTNYTAILIVNEVNVTTLPLYMIRQGFLADKPTK